jgi:hypothetical protein
MTYGQRYFRRPTTSQRALAQGRKAKRYPSESQCWDYVYSYPAEEGLVESFNIAIDEYIQDLKYQSQPLTAQ